jgi:hypothetical protein
MIGINVKFSQDTTESDDFENGTCYTLHSVCIGSVALSTEPVCIIYCLRYVCETHCFYIKHSQSESHIAIDGRSVSQSVCLCVEAICGSWRDIILFCQCGAPSLTRGRVCRLSESQSAIISQLSQCTLYLHFTYY